MTTLIVTAQVVKRCPYRDEVDDGTAVLTFDCGDGDGPELHDLAAKLASSAPSPISHEDYTRGLLARFGAVEVVTCWRTAGLDVRCEARR